MIEPCLSICIPTNGRIGIVKFTLDSIYDNCTVPFSEFEVVLSDNSKNDDLLVLLESYKKYPNIVYQKTDCEGFLNSVNALKMGKGSLLKLHNNYSMFAKDGLKSLISFVESQKENKPLIFFKSSGNKKITSYDSFDAFNKELSFYNTWSSGFSVWKDDFDRVSEKEVDKMFPQTSLFLEQHYKGNFIINNVNYFINQDVPGKGGYDLFKTFAVVYLKLMEDAKDKNYISFETFAKIKSDLFFDFLAFSYRNIMLVKNDFTFELQNIKQSIAVYYGKKGYYRLILAAYYIDLKFKVKAVLKSLKVKSTSIPK